MKCKKISRAVAALLLLAALLAVPAGAVTCGGGYVNATALYLRQEPSTSSAAIALIPGNSFLLVEEKLSGWDKVLYNGTEGYVSSEYLTCYDTCDGSYTGSVYLTGDTVRLRSSASTSGAILGCYNSGTAFSVLGVSGEWIRVQAPNGTQGYIRSDYLAPSKTETTVSNSNSTLGEQIVETAKTYIGTPYVWAGMSASGFDCSGFVNYVYKLYGYSMNRVAQDIFNSNGTAVNKSDLQPGDLVFFGSSIYSISHVGMYIGNGEFIHASSSARKVMITSLSDNWYTTRYMGARRII